MITSGEAARELGITRQTLGQWVKDGMIKPHSRTVGGHARWDLDTLREQVRQAQQERRSGDDV